MSSYFVIYRKFAQTQQQFDVWYKTEYTFYLENYKQACEVVSGIT